MPDIILRRWTGLIRTADADAYRDYIAGTGGSDYTNTPGNKGYRMLMRDLGDGTTEVVTESLWQTLDAIKAFAGDDRFLLDRPLTVAHYRIVDEA